MSNFAKLDKQDVVVEEAMDSIIMEGMDMSFGVMYDISAMNKWKSFVHSAFQNKELLSYVKKQCESIYKSKRDGNKKTTAQSRYYESKSIFRGISCLEY